MFISTRNGFINMEFVKRIEHRARTENGKRHDYDVAIDVNDEVHQVSLDNSIGNEIIAGSGKVIVVLYEPKES